MPPKSWPPRRTPNTTARKTVLSKSNPNTSFSPSSSQDSPVSPSPPPSATTAKSSPVISLDDTDLLISPGRKTNQKVESPSPPESSVISDRGIKITVGDEVRESNEFISDSSVPGITNCNADDGILVRPKRREAEIAGPGKEVMADTGRQVKGRGGDEALSEVDKAAIEAGGSINSGESRNRRVVKKTVRIVKKIVKRRVPKKVAKSNLLFEGMDNMENVGNLKERNENLEHEMNELDSMQVEKVDLDGTVSVETENSKPNDTVSVETENSKLDSTCSMEIDNSKPNDTVAYEVENEDLKEIEVEARESSRISPSVESIVKGKLGDFADKYDGKESGNIDNQLENENVKFVQNKSGDSIEDHNEDTVKSRDVEEEQVLKEVVENSDVELNGGVTMSGEMEALERKKRRRTEIFLGGLDRDTKEDDIRKIFEQVGEVTEVRLMMNGKTGQNKGFAFLRFASADDAKKALAKYSTVEIRGKQCGTQPVEGNDTIYLGNINKKWKSEDVVKLLKDAGIEKIDEVTVMANPRNFEQNRGFAFVELETSKDAQIALSKLQKHDIFAKHMKIKVAWAQPLLEPNEEEMLKVKSVYAEYLPPSWDKEKARGFFERFGELESITLAKNLASSRRKDFAFVNYTRREAALACIEAFSHEQLDDEGSKLKVKVSLAKPMPKAKQTKHVSSTTGKELVKEKQKASQPIIKVHEPKKKGKPTNSNLEDIRVDRTASTTDELLQLLRQQALVGLMRPGSSDLNHHYASPGRKRPFSALVSHPLPSDPRVVPRTMETPRLSGSPSAFPRRVDMANLPYSQQPRTNYTLESSHPVGSISLPYSQQPRTSYTLESSHHPGMVSLPYSQQPQTRYTLESSYGFENDPHHKMRERVNYFEHSGIYRRC